MNEIKNQTEKLPTGDDWAIIPHDEAADDERWAKLAQEMTALEESALSTEAIVGKMPMNRELPDVLENVFVKNSEDEMYDLSEPF